jgi:carbamoyltransferase
MNILGIHGGFTHNQHDPAAALIVDGVLIACVEEERLYRIKNPRGHLPLESIRAVLHEGALNIQDIDLIVHPGETYDGAPLRIATYLKHHFGHAPKIQMINHQLAHLASAFFHSGYEESMCLSYDAVGDRVSAALAIASKDGGIKILKTLDFESSIGVFYATMTSYLGFQQLEDEYKVMGLAPYGSVVDDLSPIMAPTNDGLYLDLSYVTEHVSIATPFEPFYSDKLVKLLGEPRHKGEPITQRHRDIAAATQQTMETCALSLIKQLHAMTKGENLCLAGGVALNCSANNQVNKLPFLKNFFVQPAASDRGLALGCALQAAYENGNYPEKLDHVFYGPNQSIDKIKKAIELTGSKVTEVVDPAETAAELIAEGKIVGWYQGRSEFGPRALGHRSILANPVVADMKDQINARVKFREEFRPFAPSVLEESAKDIFCMNTASPYMTIAFDVQENWKNKLPSVTHINGTARVQTVNAVVDPLYHRLITETEKRTDAPVVLNTSFNIKGQPIVEAPIEALSTFAGTGMDSLILGPYVIHKAATPKK